jgi:glyoxylase-like metal-dependent hydrolase (beta-lactamase superfamily II)
MSPAFRVLVWIFGLGLAGAAAHAQGRGQGPAREITQIRGDLYFARTGSHNTVFLVTPEGIILGDPISTEIAAWLRGELDSRFKQPVRYIVYSHHDFDHAEGAAVFPQAQVVAHANVLRNLDGRLHRLAGGNVDSNKNSRLEREEARGGYLSNFDRLDRNKDNALSPAELNEEIRKVDVAYTERHTLTLGGKMVQLIHPGRNHSDDMTVMYFPVERAVFAVDFIYPGTMPNTRANSAYDWTPLREWIASIRAVEALDFETFLGGHGRPGTKAEVTRNREFLEDVSAAVSKGLAEGRTLEELKKTITLDKYSAWPNFAAARLDHVEAAYNNLRDYK